MDKEEEEASDSQQLSAIKGVSEPYAVSPVGSPNTTCMDSDAAQIQNTVTCVR